jgi:chromosome segregation ATPase
MAANPGAENQVDDEQHIADMTAQLKSLQDDLADATARRAARTAFDTEMNASVSALGQAQNKAATERDDAQQVLKLTAETTGRLANDYVRSVDGAVAGVEAGRKERHDEIAALQSDLTDKVDAETDAKADNAHAKAALTHAKQILAELVTAISTQTSRVKALKDAAHDTNAKDQDGQAYVSLVELGIAVAELESLIDPQRAKDAQQAVQGAWDDAATAGADEIDAGRQVARAQESLKKAQDALADYEKNRRSEIDRVITDADAGGPAAPPAP